MRQVYAVGEIVYDIIFKNGQPQQANAGGAMLNVAVSLGRVKIPVHFIGELGNDDIGKNIKTFLHSNNVSTDFIQTYEQHNSLIALAFLNENNDARYSFYKDYPKERLTFTLPQPKQNDIVIFGSSFALRNDVRKPLLNFITSARKNGAIVIYDPNIRKQGNELTELRPLIQENIYLSDIVRGSDEDFSNICNTTNDNDIYSFIEKNGCKTLIITKNKSDIFIKSNNYSNYFKVPTITPVSTIGAGDNFNAGIIASLYNTNVQKETLDDSIPWNEIIETGILFSSNTCLSFDNYISQACADEYCKNKNHINTKK